MNLERGQTDEGQWAWQAKWQQAHSLLNKALQADTASGFSARLRPQQTATYDRPRSENTAADDDG